MLGIDLCAPGEDETQPQENEEKQLFSDFPQNATNFSEPVSVTY
jgi:hypothetical protein